MPNRPDDEEMTLHYYGEHPTPEWIEREIAADAELQRRWQKLQSELSALTAIEPPEPRAGLEGRIWHSIEGELANPLAGWTLFGLAPRRFALAAAAVLTLIAGAFLAGRLTQAPPARVAASPAGSSPAEPVAFSPASRDRLLAATLTAHLESSERLLVELANSTGGSLGQERQFAETLLASNRLYRRAAERAGQRRVAALLAELEPLFIEFAQSDAAADGDAVTAARERLESRDLLFKVRVTRGRI